MSAFKSLAIALRGHFHKSFAQLSPDIQQRVQVDFAPWPWDSKSPRERCHRAKQWDFENDPAQREIREGIEALTNPDSPAYSLEETRRLRGDFLPEPRNTRPIVDLPPLEWDGTQQHPTPPNRVDVSPSENAMVAGATKATRLRMQYKSKRRDLLSPLIESAQAVCADRYDSAEVWAKLLEFAIAKRTPFLGVSDEGLKWTDANDATQYFSIKNLRDRLRRQRKNA